MSQSWTQKQIESVAKECGLEYKYFPDADYDMVPTICVNTEHVWLRFDMKEKGFVFYSIVIDEIEGIENFKNIQTEIAKTQQFLQALGVM